MLERARAHGIPCAALIGAREHAVRQIEAGVDLLVAQGGEAGGHCGEVLTLVLIPEVMRAVKSLRPEPVLAAGGIMTGRQTAACMAMGASGVWTGSVWLATTEAETSPVFREKKIAARSRDTVRSRGRTGKPARQLRSAWTDAWEAPDSPGPLPMPQHGILSEPAICPGPRAGQLFRWPGHRAGRGRAVGAAGGGGFHDRIRRGAGGYAGAGGVVSGTGPGRQISAASGAIAWLAGAPGPGRRGPQRRGPGRRGPRRPVHRTRRRAAAGQFQGRGIDPLRTLPRGA
jgi:hypothetical protein